MASSNPTIDKLMKEAQSVKPDDPDMMEKLNQIAQQIAQAQGKAKPTTANSALVDPMDELGCEGCQ